MKQIKVLKQPTFATDKKNTRTARKYHTVFFFAQDHVYIFKNKKTMAAFIADFQKEVDIFVSVINQLTADLYFIFRQNWKIYKGKNIASLFLDIEAGLNRISAGETEMSNVVNDVIKLQDSVLEIIKTLKQTAQRNKNYSLAHYLDVFLFRTKKLTSDLLNFGKYGKWAAFGEKYNPKKLY